VTSEPERLASKISAKLRELLALQDKATVVELSIDGAQIHQTLKRLKVQPQKPDPTASLVKRARSMRRRRP
jgi:hypothetical protein